MAVIRSMLVLSLLILLLLSSSLESSASTLGSIEPLDIYVKKGGNGGGGRDGDCNVNGSGGGASYAGGGIIYIVPMGAGGYKPSNGTQRSSTIKPRPSSLASVIFVTLILSLPFASTLV
ncbi:hypothetical protein ACJRO7_026475 [Eucalyptus globulus]|uniref:Glycine-rich protein n=1 Tax=Eucalyptus globulus TaxID=34317 RepID=A0ABD3JUA5_EUCGL